MSDSQHPLDMVIWATRGHFWGFRFLLDGGHRDPLMTYERAFTGFENEPQTCHRSADIVALRFDDPSRRRDAAGRIIPHEFVVAGDLADEIKSVGDGLRHVWPLVADAYDRVWDAERPPSTTDLHFTR